MSITEHERDDDVPIVTDERRLFGRETTRFARGTRKCLLADPGELAQWLLTVMPPAMLDSDLDIEAIPGAVLVVAADGHVTEANRDALALSGYHSSELLFTRIGFHISEHVPGSAHLRRCDGTEVSIELFVCPAPNDAMIVMMRPRIPRDDHGSDDRQPTFGGVDIAEIVHDLKNPLSTIALEVAALRIRLENVALRDAHDALARIGRNVDFMDRMVHDLLDIALIGVGHFAIHRHPVDLVALVASVVGRLQSPRDRNRVTFQPHESLVAAIDELRIERVTANLIGNAMKYAPPGTPILVTVERSLHAACVSVIDTGPGLSPDEALRVFDKYQRTTSASKHDGAGLGLYVSREILEAHGGHLGVERVGTGSRFYFEIPVE